LTAPPSRVVAERPAPRALSLSVSELERWLHEAQEAGGLEPEAAFRIAEHLPEERVAGRVREAALEMKRAGWGDLVTFSRNVFIPLTNLCRNRCAYCTFAKPEDSAEAHTLGLDEVDELVRGGLATGCSEALFCLGDKPEKAWRGYRRWLAEEGYRATSEYLEVACRRAFEGGLLPHTNAGILRAEEMERLRPWNASMGLMLETASRRLREKGGPHYYAPDKEPAVRIRMHEEAGELRIPFTSGILLGIGETPAERVESLLVIRDLHARHGHIQEVIVQPFHPKPSTPMRYRAPLSDAEVASWVALARLVLGPRMSVQAPPNLGPSVLEELVASGVNDWGGVSPVTVDYINPEAPWPTLRALRERTEAAGGRLRERLPVYPDRVRNPEGWLDPQVADAVRRFADEEGFKRPDAGGMP